MKTEYIYRVYDGDPPSLERVRIVKRTSQYLYIEPSNLAFDCRSRVPHDTPIRSAREAWEDYQDDAVIDRDEALYRISAADQALRRLK